MPVSCYPVHMIYCTMCSRNGCSIYFLHREVSVFVYHCRHFLIISEGGNSLNSQIENKWILTLNYSWAEKQKKVEENFYPVGISGHYCRPVVSEFAITLFLNNQLVWGKAFLQLLDLCVSQLLGNILCQLTKLNFLEDARTTYCCHTLYRPGIIASARLVIHWGQLWWMPEAASVLHGAVAWHKIATQAATSCWGNPGAACGRRPVFLMPCISHWVWIWDVWLPWWPTDHLFRSFGVIS